MKLQKIISVSPGNNYQQIGQVAISTRTEINHKIALARQAQPAWAQLDITERVKTLNNLYTLFEKKQDALASIIAQEVGIPIKVSKQIDIGSGLQYMRGYLDNAAEWLKPEITFENNIEKHYLVYEPYGVAGVSVPWNYPFCNFIWGVIQSLVAGNTVIFKHSEECPLTGLLLDEIFHASSLPKGVFNQVYGDGSDVGEYIMNADIDLMYFTGSTGVGKHLYQVAARKMIRAILELGGSAAGIVFEDADVSAAVQSIYFYRFINSGQTCDALKRLIVHKKHFDTVVSQLKDMIATKKIGNPELPNTDLGPLVAERQMISIENQVKDAVQKGAQIVTGGKRPSGLHGAYYEPTILTNITPDMEVWKEEVFGPVLPIVSFETEEQAICLANDSQYGLGGYVYTQNKERAIRVCNQLQTGNINVNNTNYVIAQDPFGGYKKNSGLGREHGQQGMREFCNTKLIALKK